MDGDRHPGAAGRPRSPPLKLMTTLPPKDVLLASLDNVVRETLAYFEGPGRVTKARVDRWQARDVLMHFIYFHDATAWGIQSAALGGPPWPRSEEHTSELQSHSDLVCRLLLEKKKK